MTRYLVPRCLVLADHDVFQRAVHAQMRTHLIARVPLGAETRDLQPREERQML
jgi:hypothetical protein